MMQLLSISKINSVFGPSFRRTLIRSAQLSFESQILYKSSSFVRLYSSFQINKISTIKASSPPFCCVFSRKLMAASGSHSVSGDIHVEGMITGAGNVGEFAKIGAVFFGDTRVHSCRRASVSLRSRGGLSYGLVSPSVVAHGSWISTLLSGPSLRRYHVSCSASNGAAADVPFNVSVKDEQLENSVDSTACKNVEQRTLKLKSGSCYLPHPDKLKTGGEDAHFICEEKHVIGVADGVGGWADVGVDAGFYARLLMSNSLAAIKESKGSVDPAKVLEEAHANTNVIGSSTACIVALTNKGIHAINLGDSAFIVIREGSTVFRSPVQQYGFNFPYQLANGNGGDLPSSGQVFTFPVASGDVLVAGTDGLFDNMYDNEICALVVQGTRSGLEPKTTAQNIANLAQQRAQDRHRQTPFSAAAHDAGIRYMGGKLDDITVVVSYITGDI